MEAQPYLWPGRAPQSVTVHGAGVCLLLSLGEASLAGGLCWIVVSATGE